MRLALYVLGQKRAAILKSLGPWLEEKAQKNCDRTFVRFRGREVSYLELNERASILARGFLDLGLKKGDHVAFLMPNHPDFLSAWFALAKIGAVLVAVNTQLKGPGLRYILDQSDSRALLLSSQFYPQIEPFERELKNLRTLILWGDELSGSPSRNALHFSKLLQGRPASEQVRAEVDGSDPLIITYTSGTTGMPKGVVNSHNAYIQGGIDLASICAFQARDRIYTFLPLFHANPQVYCVMGALAADASLILTERFSATKFWDEVRENQATLFSYVGTVLSILLKQPPGSRDSENPARACFGGGAPRDVFGAFMERFKVDVLELYGMSETGAFNTINHPGRIHVGSVGTHRPGFEVRIFDEKDREVPPQTTGEFVIRPLKPYIMFEGYYRKPEETLESYRNLWFHTGDLGWKDGEGFFYFVGRKKENIRRGGENITPYEIESVINAHPQVLESAVVGIPSEVMGEEIKACVVPRPGKSLTPESLLQWCLDRLAEFMIPRYIEILDHLPKTGSEKVQRFLLKEGGTAGAWDRKKQPGKDL